MLIAVAIACLVMGFGARGTVGAPGRMQALAEMAYEFVAGMVRSAAGEAGMRFFPLVFCLFLFIVICNLIGPHPLFLHGDEPHHRHRLDGFARLLHRRHRRHQGTRDAFLQAVRALGRADLHSAARRGDRGHLVPDAAVEPFGSPVRQHARRPHHAQRIRRFRRHAARRRARRPRRSRCCPSR